MAHLPHPPLPGPITPLRCGTMLPMGGTLHPAPFGNFRRAYTPYAHSLCSGSSQSVLSSDTHPKMEALQIQLWRQASLTRKIQALGDTAKAHGLDPSKVRQPLVCLTPATAAHVQAKGIVQDFAHFSIRNTQAMLPVSRQSLGAWPDHDACGSRCLRDLFRMMRPHTSMTMPTPTAVDEKSRRLHLGAYL